MTFDPWSWLPAQPFANARPDAPKDPASLADSPDAIPGEPPIVAVPADDGHVLQRPWKYLYPHSWVFKLLTDPFGLRQLWPRSRVSGHRPGGGKHALTFDAIVPA